MKPKRFDPVVSRVKLNPEQAVLACACHNVSRYLDWGDGSRHGGSPTYYKVCGAVTPKGVSNEPQCSLSSGAAVATSKSGSNSS